MLQIQIRMNTRTNLQAEKQTHAPLTVLMCMIETK